MAKEARRVKVEGTPTLQIRQGRHRGAAEREKFGARRTRAKNPRAKRETGEHLRRALRGVLLLASPWFVGLSDVRGATAKARSGVQTAQPSEAMTEPGVASSDATNISTRIEGDGDDYVVNGHKWWSIGLFRDPFSGGPLREHASTAVAKDARSDTLEGP